ncbi:hypothetical protein ACFU9B_40380 [Streptomyces sp. NPDC057592]|uniref:hypothetical protein n=1 Tax=unclassified Streptomyces TaxID=2593676 RepID=UPI00369F5F7C
MGTVNNAFFTGVAWFMGIALSISVLTLAANPLLKRLALKSERRKEAKAQRRGDEHYRKLLQAATDHAITTAVRARLAEPVVDLHITIPMRVSVGDVIARALDDFALDVPRDHAAAMLRHRLIFRGHAGWPDLITDAFDDEEDQAP